MKFMKFYSLLFIVLFFIGYSNAQQSVKAYVGTGFPNNNTVKVIDTSTNTVIATISDLSFSGIQFIAVTPDQTKVYVVNNNSTISVINAATNTVSTVISDASFNTPLTMTISPDGLKAYIPNFGFGGGISILNIATDTVTGVVQNTSGNIVSPTHVVFIPGTSKAYVSSSGNNQIGIINTDTDTLITPNISGPFNFPYIMAATPDGTKVYVTNLFVPSVNIIDAVSDTVPVPSTVDDTNSPFIDTQFVAITPDGTKAYVANGTNVLSVDVATNKVIGAVSGTSNNIFALALTPDGQKVYVTNNNNPGTVGVIDVATDTQTVLIPGFNFPFAIGIAPAPLIQAPSNLRACTAKNVFLTQTDFVNIITWNAPTIGSTPSTYRIYRNAALTDLAGTVSGTARRCFIDHNRLCNVTYTYYIVSVDAHGIVSQPAVAVANVNC